ncbi:MAG: nucleoside triphosphate pyrophosphohydrolase [Candidatus Saccharicenans sp.]
MNKETQVGHQFQQLVEIIAKLRSPGGCPWDRQRTKEEILSYFLEEVYEAVEAVSSGNPEAAREELGDVLMEVIFLARFYQETGKFGLAEILAGINRKMIERHPHVFGRKRKPTPEAVLNAWQKNKLAEKSRSSVLDGLPASAPALISAFLLGQRAAAQGFDWPDPGSVLQKVKEEIQELEHSLNLKNQSKIAEELGDVLFSLVNLCRWLRLNPEILLRQANKKFENRFRQLEKELKKRGKELKACSSEELDEIWEKVKGKSRVEKPGKNLRKKQKRKEINRKNR